MKFDQLRKKHFSHAIQNIPGKGNVVVSRISIAATHRLLGIVSKEKIKEAEAANVEKIYVLMRQAGHAKR